MFRSLKIAALAAATLIAGATLNTDQADAAGRSFGGGGFKSAGLGGGFGGGGFKAPSLGFPGRGGIIVPKHPGLGGIKLPPRAGFVPPPGGFKPPKFNPRPDFCKITGKCGGNGTPPGLKPPHGKGHAGWLVGGVSIVASGSGSCDYEYYKWKTTGNLIWFKRYKYCIGE